MNQKKIDDKTGIVFNNICSRSDGVKFDGLDFSDPIVKKFIHKEVIVKTGDGEDDWIKEEKPVQSEEYDIQKAIDEAAKGADVKSLIEQVLRTGDDTILNQTEVSYGDITEFPTSPIAAHNAINNIDNLKSNLPPEFVKDDESLMKLSKKEIDDYVKAKVDEILASKNNGKETVVPAAAEGEK